MLGRTFLRTPNLSWKWDLKGIGIICQRNSPCKGLWQEALGGREEVSELCDWRSGSETV
jgi:hypothetical protein